MFCTSCGKPIPDDSRFCTECGAVVAGNVVVETAPEMVAPEMAAPEMAAPQDYQMPPQGYQAPPQGYQVPPQGYQMPPQGYQMPPQGYQMPPQGYQMPPQGYQMPPQGYAPAPKSVNFGALWNDNTKRPLFYMFGIAFTVLIAMFFNFISSGYWGFSGYELLEWLEDGEFISILLLFSLLTAIGIMVFAALGLFKAGMSKKALKLVFMISSLAYATFAFILTIIVLSDEVLGFGAVLNFLLGGGMVFVYFFFLNKIYANKPVAPQNIYNQPMGM